MASTSHISLSDPRFGQCWSQGARPNPSLEPTRFGKAHWPPRAPVPCCSGRPVALASVVGSAQTLGVTCYLWRTSFLCYFLSYWQALPAARAQRSRSTPHRSHRSALRRSQRSYSGHPRWPCPIKRDVAAREEAASSGLSAFFANSGCFAKAELRKVPVLSVSFGRRIPTWITEHVHTLDRHRSPRTRASRSSPFLCNTGRGRNRGGSSRHRVLACVDIGTTSVHRPLEEWWSRHCQRRRKLAE